MKSPLGKLRKFPFYKNDSKDKRDLQSSAQLDELAQAAKVLFFPLLLSCNNFFFLTAIFYALDCF